MADSNEQCRLINVRRQYMRLLAQIRATADDIIASGQDGRDPRRAVTLLFQRNVVTHRHGVGGANTGYTQVTLDTAVSHRAIGCQHAHGATGYFYHQIHNF